MRKLLIAAAAGLMTLAALPAAASAAAQERPYMQQDRHDDRNDRGRNDRDDRRNDRGDRGDRNDRGGRDNDRYGRWDGSWGARPAGPPRHWTRQNDWYRHVRACQQRFRSYNPATDRYTVRRGQTAMCRL